MTYEEKILNPFVNQEEEEGEEGEAPQEETAEEETAE